MFWGMQIIEISQVLLLQLPCRQTLAVMYFHIFLSLVLFITSVFDILPCHFVMLSNIFSRCLPLSHLPKIFPVVIVCSNFPFLSIRPLNFDCVFLTSVIRLLFVLACFKMSLLDILAVRGTFIILLKNHISAASSCFCMFLFIVKASLP